MDNKPEAELKQLAEDIIAGRVFTDRHINNIHDLRAVFMIFSLLDDEQRSKLQADPPGLVYEYLSEAGPMSVNGMPSFLSVRMISKDDAAKVFDYVQKIKEAIAAV